MKTARQHFELFKATCTEYQQKLGLTDWDFRYAHRNHADTDTLAHVYCNVEGRIASLYLAVDWGTLDKPTPAAVRQCARHEVLHVLLADVMELASRQHGSHPATREAAEHAVIRRLERLV